MAFCPQCTNTLFPPSQAQLTQQQQFEATMKEQEERWKQQRQQESMQFQTTLAQSMQEFNARLLMNLFKSDKPDQP